MLPKLCATYTCRINCIRHASASVIDARAIYIRWLKSPMIARGQTESVIIATVGPMHSVTHAQMHARAPSEELPKHGRNRDLIMAGDFGQTR